MAESQLRHLLSQYVSSWGEVDMSFLRTSMEAVAPDRRYEVVSSVRDWQQRTVVHVAVLKHDTEVIKCVMELLTEEDSYRLMKRQNVVDQTAIHFAVIPTSHRSLEMLKCLLESAKVEECYQMLQIQDYCDNTAIHCAAYSGYTEELKYLLDLLPPNKQIQLLNLQNKYNNTPLDEAKLANHTTTIERLRLYRSNAKAHLKKVQETQREINIGNESPTSVQLARQAEQIHEQNQQIRTLKRQASEHNKVQEAKVKKLEFELTDQKQKSKNLKDEIVKSKLEVADLRRKLKEQQNETTKFRQESKQEIVELKETVAALQEVMTQSVSQSAAGPSFSNHLTEVGEVKKVMVNVERQDMRIELEEQTRAVNIFQEERLQETTDQLEDHAAGMEYLADQIADHAAGIDDLTNQVADNTDGLHNLEQRADITEERLLILEGR